VSARLDLSGVRTLLCDADGNLFPSEDPAFVASTTVTNRLLADLGIDRRFEPEELRRVAIGKNFRSTAIDLAAEHGVVIDAEELERRVDEERREVTAYLGEVLGPDPAVSEPLARLGERFALTVVSSSALGRLAACFTATDLDDLFPPQVRYSAEDSLPVPTSKPDPAIYTFAARELGITTAEGLAIEDSTTGTLSAVAAGLTTIGNVVFVAPGERAARTQALLDAGAAVVVSDWLELEALLDEAVRPPAPAPACG
jgi:beta-phosphoglucomutase-like phosphatase (HAD superfamily)